MIAHGNRKKEALNVLSFRQGREAVKLGEIWITPSHGTPHPIASARSALASDPV